MLHVFNRQVLGVVAAAAAALGATPALANSSAAAADIAAPLRTNPATSATVGNGDEQFKNLFASWQALDRSTAQAPSASGVSIPSRIPVDGYKLTSAYGMRVHPVLGGRRSHKGLDMASPVGTAIHAAADGIVGKADWFGGYGLYVALEHGGSMETRYGHMSRLNVSAGQRVRKGEVIGYVGTTGRSTGPHLHYEVRIAGEAVNPIPYLQSGGAPLTLAALDTSGKGGPE
ncbi:MAG: M23 family metallopeptidase [Novosphingobium sp.]